MSPAARMATGATAIVAIRGSQLEPPVLSSYVRTDRLGRLEGGARRRRVWRLHQSYRYDAGEYSLFLPAGFEFDLASVPRPLWSVISPTDLSIVAPLLHDFIYQYGGRPPYGTVAPWFKAFDRLEADRLFLRAMEQEGVSAWRRELAYRAVRMYGASSWRIP